MTEETPLGEKVNRVETIIETLEDDDISLEHARELHEEGQDLLEQLQNDLAVGDGELIEQ